jgi:hypothetical protein
MFFLIMQNFFPADFANFCADFGDFQSFETQKSPKSAQKSAKSAGKKYRHFPKRIAFRFHNSFKINAKLDSARYFIHVFRRINFCHCEIWFKRH